ncbi:MAG TPA: GAF domain-containing protein, partial [Roseiflexaceae bacterium]|nr:GAF domain-containing protein [Roseiflexaceae bacterium]
MLNVLILDDDALFGRSLANNLRLSKLVPCHTTYVTSADEAYAAVHNAHLSFDVFLLDQRLGSGPDGIEVLDKLLELSPKSEAVVFTQAGDSAAGLRAYRAGAYRYLHKPLDPEELEIVLASLKAWRDTLHERDGLLVLTKISEVSQELLPISVMGERLVAACCDLGFERARLWLLDPDQKTLVGLSESGNQGLETFTGERMLVAESVYAQRTLGVRGPRIFHGHEYGASFLSRRHSDKGYQAPTSDWVGVPLWTPEGCLGMLMLDNHLQQISLRAHLSALLHTLGNMVAAALYRASCFEHEQRKRRELEVLDDIGRRASNRAVRVDLDELLKDVQEALARLMDVETFLIALYDDVNEVIELRLDTEQGQLLQPRKLRNMRGLIGHVLRKNQPLFLPDRASIDGFYKQFKIRKYRCGAPAKCWLGVPLALEGRAVGAIVVQSITQEYVYTEEDRRVLIAVADQITGAIQNARLREATERNAQRLAVLQQAGGELLSLAESSEEWLWHALLTLATAHYALGFNRAMLFLLEDGGMILRGRMGIGQFSSREARRHWRKDRKGNLDFTTYLAKLREECLAPTAVDDAVRHFKISLRYHHSIFSQVTRERRRAKVEAAAGDKDLMRSFVQTFGRTTYALLPLYIGEQSLGVVVVDNAHNSEPLDDVALDQLETVLAQVALIYENLRQRRGNNQLIKVSQTVLADVSDQTIKETLLEICEVVQTITRADSVAIYPLMTQTEAALPRFDIKHAAAVGLNSDLNRNQPTSDGFTKEILASGQPLAVPNIHHSQWARIEDRSFVKREDVRAFIASPIRDSSSKESIGLLFLNYGEQQRFDHRDTKRAQAFADLAGAAIRTARAEEQMRQNLGEAEFYRQARERELGVLHEIMTLALRPKTSRQKVIHALLLAAHDLLGLANIDIRLLLRHWTRSSGSQEEPIEIREHYYLDIENNLLKRSFSE